MRIFFILVLFLFSYAKNLEVVKYVSHKEPKIIVLYNNFPNKLKKILSLDAEIIANYKLKFQKNYDDENIKESYPDADFVLKVNFKNNRLYVVLKNLGNNKIILKKMYQISSFKVYPFMIHKLSYDINSKLGFPKVDWINKKIVYSVYMGAKEQAIFVADITLTYRKKIIFGGLNVFPKWANKEQTEIYYTKLEISPVLYKYNIYTGAKSRVLSTEGMLVVSDVKGDKLLLTLAIDEQPDVCEYNVKNHILKRVTNFSGIDVNGHFYGNEIVFISDRLGYPNVYKKNLTTGKVSKLFYYGKNHIAVAVNKDKIVVSSRETDNAFEKNSFNLLLIKKGESAVKRLTFEGKNISPVFSDDGTTLLFIKEYKFNSKFGIIRLDKNKILYFRINRRIQAFDF